MIWLLALVGLVVIAALVILFLNGFYKKGSREVALIRTGAGGRKIVIDGGCLALPFLHRIERVSLRTIRLEVSRRGARALMTEDRLRADIDMEFHVRVHSENDSVASAAQTLGSRTFRPEDLQALIEGKLVDSMQAVAATMTMDALHVQRAAFAERVASHLTGNLARNGLELEAVSLLSMDQTPLAALDENNAFDAMGMRQIAEVIATNRKQRVEIEVAAEIAVKRSRLEQARQSAAIEQEQREFEIAQRREIERFQAEAEAQIAQARAEAARIGEEARIRQDADIKFSEIARDQELRLREMSAILAVESGKIDNAIRIAAKRGEETQAQATAESARERVVIAMETVQTSKDIAAAERARRLALLRAEESAAVDRIKTEADNESMLTRMRAETTAAQARAEAERERMIAEATGRAALIKAENEQSPAVMALKLDMYKLDKFPEIAAQMMKPVEKIESIRINQIAGLGGNGPGSGAAGAGSAFNQALDSILGMAVQLPMMKKIGDEIGLDFDANLATRVNESAGRTAGAHRSEAAKPKAQD